MEEETDSRRKARMMKVSKKVWRLKEQRGDCKEEGVETEGARG